MWSVRCVAVVLLNTLSLFSFSQDVSHISGKVLDAQTKEALPFAAVYLARTTIGVAADSEGRFTLEKIPAGKYDLTVSMLGYRILSTPVLFPEAANTQFVIELESEPEELDAVTINDTRIKQSARSLSKFKKYFLGQTKNSYSCKILNPQDVFTYEQDGELIALTKKPIEVENEALGFKVIFDLKEFKVNYLNNQVITVGIPRFEELTPKNERQRKEWDYERDRAYYGSFEHFLKSLIRDELRENFFAILDQQKNEIMREQIVKSNVITYTGSLYVVYTKEQSEFRPIGSRVWVNQNSELQFNGNPITVYENGYFEKFNDLILRGYFGWTSHIAELLPHGYEPTRNIKAL